MNGYQYLIERNRLMYRYEDELAKLRHLPEAERKTRAARCQAEFDRQIADLYSQVAAEYPGERIKKARSISDPR